MLYITVLLYLNVTILIYAGLFIREKYFLLFSSRGFLGSFATNFSGTMLFTDLSLVNNRDFADFAQSFWMQSISRELQTLLIVAISVALYGLLKMIIIRWINFGTFQ